MQPQRTAFLLLVSLALLGLGLLATLGVAGLFSEDLKEATSTAGIEVVLADRNGYRHFLVFDRVRSVENLSADYSVELWVDNFVALDPQPVSRLVFFQGRTIGSHRSFGRNRQPSQCPSDDSSAF